MIKKLFVIICVLFTLTFAGCKSKGENMDSSPTLGASDNVEIFVDTSRKIYYTVSYNYQTSDVEELSKKISAKVGELEGFTSDSSTNFNQETNECIYANYQFRIPTTKLNEFISYLDGCEGLIRSNLESSDVTETYEANQARIDTLTARLAAYNKLLEEKNMSMHDIITLESKIDEINTELVKLNNLKNKYDSLIEYATFNVNISTEYSYVENSWFGNYWIYLKDLAIVIFSIIMYTLPFTLVAGTILFIILRKRKINKNKNKQG